MESQVEAKKPVDPEARTDVTFATTLVYLFKSTDSRRLPQLPESKCFFTALQLIAGMKLLVELRDRMYTRPSQCSLQKGNSESPIVVSFLFHQIVGSTVKLSKWGDRTEHHPSAHTCNLAHFEHTSVSDGRWTVLCIQCVDWSIARLQILRAREARYGFILELRRCVKARRLHWPAMV